MLSTVTNCMCHLEMGSSPVSSVAGLGSPGHGAGCPSILVLSSTLTPLQPPTSPSLSFPHVSTDRMFQKENNSMTCKHQYIFGKGGGH